MRIPLHSITLIIMLPLIMSGQGRNFWSSVEKDELPTEKIIDYSTSFKNPPFFELDKEAMTSFLEGAPDRFESDSSSLVLQFPNSRGGFDSFEMFSTQTMARELAEQHPGIKSYVGRNISDKSHTLRVTVTPYGFYGMTLGSKEGLNVINPYATGENFFVIHSKKQASENLHALVCEFDETFKEAIDENHTHAESNLVNQGILRKYRIGIASTNQYSSFHWQLAGVSQTASDVEKRDAVQAAMVVTLDRVNEMYERDLSVTYEFIPNNSVLIVINPNQDPYTNNNVGQQLNQNQTRFNQLIGSANYDIGHVFSTAGSGVAVLQSVCNNNLKAQGATGLPQPLGDIFDIDYVSHEIGHQMGANHTFNNSCFGNRNDATAVEPGAGSTIMAYAGVCSPGPQNSSDAMFHLVSITEMRNFYNTFFGGCAQQIPISNQAPIVNSLPSYTIPRNTPFMLEAVATDADNDQLTYSWEQLDNEIISAPPTGNNTSGPTFRAFLPSENPIRYFPSMSTILNNQYSNNWEVLPFIQRTLNFGVAVRDNNMLGGQVSETSVALNVVNAGPFRVTSQGQSGIVWEPGDTETVTWVVAETNNPSGVNAQNVDIFLSLDNGQNFNVVLASNVPNNGSAEITVPNVFTNSGRIMVKGADNVFFDINNAFIAINGEGGSEEECEEYANDESIDIPDGAGPNQQGTPIFSEIDVEDDVIISGIKVNVDITHTYIQDLVIQLIGPDEQFINLFVRDCLNEGGIQVTFDDLGQPIPEECSDPLAGVFSPSDANKSLQQWNGLSALGDWTLAIADFFIGDVGTLNSWSLEICTTSLGVQDQTASTFGIYPNPSNGQFVLNLGSPLNQNTNAKIYNLQGKLLQEIEVRADRLQQNIVLEKVAQGVYLFEINDGTSRMIEKLIIK